MSGADEAKASVVGRHGRNLSLAELGSLRVAGVAANGDGIAVADRSPIAPRRPIHGRRSLEAR